MSILRVYLNSESQAFIDMKKYKLLSIGALSACQSPDFVFQCTAYSDSNNPSNFFTKRLETDDVLKFVCEGDSGAAVNLGNIVVKFNKDTPEDLSEMQLATNIKVTSSDGKEISSIATNESTHQLEIRESCSKNDCALNILSTDLKGNEQSLTIKKGTQEALEITLSTIKNAYA
ncbi:MAG: hypothetical protein OQK04_18960 [Kangiellaceae bacterium]|nr:hypothetical protein [Kangiellaceae bacterium]MCW9000798.1 hypothetical protein [Kangiellaceae bacterium]